MKRILKYNIEVVEDQTVRIPIGFEVLSIQVQQGQIKLWALVDDSEEEVQYIFRIVGTGEPIRFDMNEWQYLSTVQLDGFVWHIFRDA